jgi:hypothetical protein
MSTYEFLLHVTLILTILEKLTRLIGLVTIRKSVFSDAQAVSAGRPAKTSVSPAQSTGQKSKRT